jgi:hypothetical protein
MTVAKVLKAIVLALILAILLAIIGAILAGVGQENALFAIFFWVGLIGFTILFLKVQMVGFWFCLSYAIEWALLPIAAAINTTQPVKETGCAGLFGAIAATVFLAITIPVGAIGFVLFLLLALLVFRKKKPPTAKPTSEESPQP